MTSLAETWASLPVGGWLILLSAALLVGFSKTALGGLAMVAVVLFALVIPARDSTGSVLLLLLVGDVFAVWLYRRHADVKLILSLIVPVLAGIGVGALFLYLVDDQVLRRTIGGILLVLLILGAWPDRLAVHRPGVAMGYGALAGFTTMVANAGGPAMSLYLLAAKYDKWRFLGTTAWFFFAVNLTKLPISIALGIVRADTAMLAAICVPAVLVGASLGRVVIKRIPQKVFERLVTLFVAISAGYLLFF